MRNLRQQRIFETLKRLPEHERAQADAEETKNRRMELRETKVNIWKKWRGKEMPTPPQDQASMKDSRLTRMEEIINRMRREVEKRKEVEILENAKRQKLLEDKKTRQEKIMRQAQEKKHKIAKKRMLEERWEMARWITTYISENEDRWLREKKERNMNEKKRLESWARMTRLEKIRIIREKDLEKRIMETKPCLQTLKPQHSA